MISAEEAIESLKKGNEQYVSVDTFHTDVSSSMLEHFAKNGQEPYAIIISYPLVIKRNTLEFVGM